jgi:hypothetical protein
LKVNLLHHLSSRLTARALLAIIFLGISPACHAQQQKAGGSPLDTLLSTKLWADVPEPKDFVRETRPPPDSLTYQPLTAIDPERPKPKTKEELKALESELQQAAEHNFQSGRKRVGVNKPPPAKTAKRN